MKHRILCVLAFVALPIVFAASAEAQETWIIDILGNPARYWNTTVTIVGQVQQVVPNPAGTTRGVYTSWMKAAPIR